LAGGSMEVGEALEQVAKRELLEATGLLANDLTLFNVFSGQEFCYKYPHGDEVHNVVAAYFCRDYKGTLKREENEVEALKFFNMTDLPSNISPPDLPIVNEYLHKFL